MNKTRSLYIAMILAGIAGYFVLWCSVRVLEPLDYALFASFWSALYFFVGSLAGFQQEVTRASKPANSGNNASGESYRGAAFKLALTSASTILAIGLIIYFGYFLVSAGTPNSSLASSIFPISVSLAGYVVVAIIAGSLYGLKQWLLLALMIIGDATLRFVFVLWVLASSASVDLLIWAASVPFGLTILLLSPWLRKALKTNVVTDVPLGKLWINSLQAVAAAIGMSLIVSGFPLILSLTSQNVEASVLSQSMFIVTLARAPFVIVAISLQSLLLVKFKAASDSFKLILRIGLIFIGMSILLIPIGIVISQPLLELLVGAPASLSPLLLTAIVISGLLLAFLVITGVAVLAQSHHIRYATGWAVAAIMTVVVLLLPLEFEFRVIVALVLPPLLGILIHILGIRKIMLF